MNVRGKSKDGFPAGCSAALCAALIVAGLGATTAQAASLTINYTAPGDVNNSFFFGQRGAGVAIEGVEGTPDFGHPVDVVPPAYDVDRYGAGTASQTVEVSGVTYQVGETLEHWIRAGVDHGNPSQAQVKLHSSLSFTGLLPAPYSVTLTNDRFDAESTSYADATAKAVFRIEGHPGERVRVHIDASASSATNNPDFSMVKAALGGAFPDDFSIWHNGAKIWDAGHSIDKPNGKLLDDFTFEAVAGDVFAVDASVLAQLGGDTFDADFEGNYAWINFEAQVGLEPVPLPAALPLFLSGLGLMGFAGIRRTRQG